MLTLSQFIITLTSLAENVYSITKQCRWLSTPVIVLRTIAWTAWNGIFLSMLVCAVSTSVHGLVTALSELTSSACRLQ